MSRSARSIVVVCLLLLVACAIAADNGGDISEYNADETREAGHFAYGQPATAEQIAGWDIDIRPDGVGLPPGGATAEDGEMLYEDQCAICHGSFGEGVGRYPILAGGEGTLTESRPEKTVGSFWPYASTLWDYIHRAMPFAEPQSLSDADVYAITAYVLYLNDLVEYDFELTQENLAEIEMPNKNGFFLDDRPDVRAKRCMKNCKDPASIRITSEPEIVEEEPDLPEAIAVAVSAPGQAVYEQSCSLCHASGVGEAPIPGDADVWAERMEAGRDAMLANAIAGIGIMPPRGGHQLTDAEVASAVDYIISITTN
jgi:S-disulfanyl-L-cysteine oxidoreductase SoxD